MHAYCFASGQIEFGARVPDGALPIARGPRKELQDFISGVARRAHDGETLLVPGVPEAGDDQFAALGALQKFNAWIAKQKPDGVKVCA